MSQDAIALHGTAFDIAGRNRANPQSLKEAIRMAARMAGWNKSMDTE